jgi:hypothetical protein
MGLPYQRYMTDGYEGLVKYCQGNPEVLGEGPTPKIPHNTMGLNRGFLGEKIASNTLSHGTVN